MFANEHIQKNTEHKSSIASKKKEKHKNEHLTPIFIYQQLKSKSVIGDVVYLHQTNITSITKKNHIY